MGSSHVLWRQFFNSAPLLRYRATCRFIGTDPTRHDRAIVQSTLPPPSWCGIDSRWLSVVKGRIGRCLAFGPKPRQVNEAGEILKILARDWRELIAGSEGFLTGEGRRGLFCQSVAWGEMVDILLPPCVLPDCIADKALLLAD
jgi:hypothetical protein